MPMIIQIINILRFCFVDQSSEKLSQRRISPYTEYNDHYGDLPLLVTDPEFVKKGIQQAWEHGVSGFSGFLS